MGKTVSGLPCRLPVQLYSWVNQVYSSWDLTLTAYFSDVTNGTTSIGSWDGVSSNELPSGLADSTLIPMQTMNSFKSSNQSVSTRLADSTFIRCKPCTALNLQTNQSPQPKVCSSLPHTQCLKVRQSTSSQISPEKYTMFCLLSNSASYAFSGDLVLGFYAATNVCLCTVNTDFLPKSARMKTKIIIHYNE